jgi:putative tricarboxylic transport membrane protein
MNADRAGAFAGALLGLFLVWQGSLLPKGEGGSPGSGFLAICIGVGLVILSAALWVYPIEKISVRGLFPPLTRLKWIAWFIALLSLFALLMRPLGFLITTFAFFLVLLQSYERTHWFWAIALSLVAAIGSYWLFGKVFEVSLPEGLLSF